jgi:hypothetical protein
MYTLRLYQDRFDAGAAARLYAQHSIVYVFAGGATVKGQSLSTDRALYVTDAFEIRAGEGGATVWRGELVRTEDPANLATGEGVFSVLAMTRKVKMFEMYPTTRWMFKLDCIVKSEGSTGLHSHPGSGIRCLISGKLTTISEKGENTVNEKTGDVWYEEGAYPLVSLTEQATFLRWMILPPEYADVPGESPNWIEGAKGCTSDWKGYIKQVIHLR